MPEKWDQIVELFNAALERAPAERQDFLRQACAEDQLLRAEVESLLSSYDESFLEKSPTTKILSHAADPMIGKQLGAYRIVQKSGEGGMAVVYLAERADEQFRKRVAIKMVKPGANNAEILRRFRNERQTLAALDHPNIVRLLDGGSTEDGLPYLVMDYVEGIPIDRYCDTRRLAVPERLQLFRSVCSVVHYAHENLVIHRDLKPSNILMSADGAPRLLDFGIAKLLNPQCFQTQLVTMGDWRPMTPEYASPEQVRGEPLTSASDVYSLGVLLYQLLTGHLPYATTRQSLSEMERKICEQEPEKPSIAIGNSEESAREDDEPSLVTPDTVSRARNTTPQELRSILEGDLDAIVLMALCKEPQRRYASAADFAADIERFLSGQPVRARRSTVIYRSRKFLGRHKEALATIIVALALIASFGVWESRRLEQQSGANNASKVHGPARPSVALLGFKNLSGRSDTTWVSTALSEMLTTDLGAGEQLRTISGETVARTKIDLSLPDEVSLAPDTLHRVRKNLRSDYVVLGSYLDMGKDSGGQVRLDLRVQDTAKGETVASVSETGTEAQLLELVSRAGASVREQLGVAQVSSTDSASIKASLPSNPEAVRLYSQGLAKLRSFDALGARDLLIRAVDTDPTYPLAHSALAKAWLSLGYQSNAEHEAKKAMDSAENLPRQDRLLVEARYYEASKQWDKAIETYSTLFNFFPDNLEFGLYLTNAQIQSGKGKDALATIERLRNFAGPAKDDPRIDMAQVEAAAAVSDNKGAADAAEKAAAKASATGARLLVARARAYQCRAFANLGEPDKSKVACLEAERIYRDAGDLAGVAHTLHSMAEVPLDQGDVDKAQQLYEQALAIARGIGDTRGISREMGNLALISATRGDFAAAEKMYGESAALTRETGDKRGLSVDLGNMGDVLFAEGRVADSLASYHEALALARETGHKSSEAIDIKDIGDILVEQGELDGARKMYDEALPIQREIGERSYYAATLIGLGFVAHQKGDFDTANKYYDEALALYQQLGEKGGAASAQTPLSQLYCDIGRPADAEALARSALYEYHLEKQTSAEVQALNVLITSLLQQGKLDEARSALDSALKLSNTSPDLSMRIPLQVRQARVRAASGDIRGGQQLAQSALTQATKLGFVRLQFEASLALGEIQMKSGNRAAGRTYLHQLEKTTRAKGFKLIADKAAAAARV